jgi:hypothetical protein
MAAIVLKFSTKFAGMLVQSIVINTGNSFIKFNKKFLNSQNVTKILSTCKQCVIITR